MRSPLASLLFSARKRAGLSQREVAERVGTHPTRVSRLESGTERLGLEKTQVFAAALDTEHRLVAQAALQAWLGARGQTYRVVLRRGQRVGLTGAAVKRLRLEQGLSLRDVAALLDVAPPRVAEIERGVKLLLPETVLHIADQLGGDPPGLLASALQDVLNRDCGMGFVVRVS